MRNDVSGKPAASIIIEIESSITYRELLRQQILPKRQDTIRVTARCAEVFMVPFEIKSIHCLSRQASDVLFSNTPGSCSSLQNKRSSGP